MIGITPACAGKRLVLLIFSSQLRDHPRVCGEKAGPFLRITWLQGSPPRVRGKDLVQFCLRPLFGITPACAGKRTKLNTNSQGGKDHPRVCGEKHTNISVRPIPPGSPPRMRGKGISFSVSCSSSGITPAYAGKRYARPLTMVGVGDHPRVCGEKQKTPPWGVEKGGSPPRMRGKADQLPGGFWDAGITPAYAGKSP